MRRKAIMALLALGVVGGYGSGFAHLACARHWREEHRQQVMNEFARTCVDAARVGNNGASAAVAPGVAPTVTMPIVIPITIPSSAPVQVAPSVR